MEVLKLVVYQGSECGRFNSLKKKTVRFLLWFHNFRSGELAKMGDGFGWPEQGTLLWKLKLGMALMALSLGLWQPQTSPSFEKRSTYVYFIFRLVHVLACSIGIYNTRLYIIYMYIFIYIIYIYMHTYIITDIYNTYIYLYIHTWHMV